jgi:hypothetical protein
MNKSGTQERFNFERLLHLWRSRITAETERRLRAMAHIRYQIELERLRKEIGYRQKQQDAMRERLAERDRLWEEYESSNRESFNQDRARLQRALLEEQARIRRAEKERENWWRHKDQIREERKRQKYEKERLQREELKRDKEDAARAASRAAYQKQWPLDQRDRINRLRAQRKTIRNSTDRLRFDMEAACEATSAWMDRFPRIPVCPLLSAWRERSIARFNKWSQKKYRRDNPEWRSERADETTWPVMYSTLHLAPRRPTLSEYDNRRGASVPDRYRFGIYAGQYDG